MVDRNIGKVSSSSDSAVAARRRAGRIKRPELRRRPTPVGAMGMLRETLAHPAALPVLFIAIGLSFVLTITAMAGQWAVVAAPDRVSDRTYIARIDFSVKNEERTESRRELREASTARVYAADEEQLIARRQQLVELPLVVAKAESLEDVPADIRLRYSLSPDELSALQEQVVEGEVRERWAQRVDQFIASLRERPILPEDEIQTIRARGIQRLLLTFSIGEPIPVLPDNVINLDDDAELESELVEIAQRAQFYAEYVDVVVASIVNSSTATFFFDEQATLAQIEAASDVVFDEFAEGQIIVPRGEVLDARDVELLRAEREAFREALGWERRVSSAGALWALMASLVVGLGGYLYIYNRRVVVRPWRSFAIAALIAVAQFGAVWLAIAAPFATWLGVALALTLITMVIVTAHDRRMALVVAGVTIAATGIALSLSVAQCLAIFVGAATAAWRLSEIRSRADVVRATVLVMAALALGVTAVSVVERPSTPGVLNELPWDIGLAAIGGFVAGALTLFLMPTVEKVFDVTTGMTLSELRDPKQPLLRMLQQRAPGTYNHSLNVATIAEAGAQAIGADALHLYVGCLYHDVGKLNKPDYFVENQPRGLNRHDKLSPAMSLLVIMGHVKDGLELAREYNLPRSLHHYIESHHGETLVTYFFHQAKQAAESDANIAAPDEIEYRYPGPKPRTKEAAILMLCDAVEGATRAMSEPTPSRIATLVHDIAMARLHDGQFEDCELTFAELRLIEDAVTKALCSIYHGRIAYPSADTKSEDPSQAKREQAKRATS